MGHTAMSSYFQIVGQAVTELYKIYENVQIIRKSTQKHKTIRITTDYCTGTNCNIKLLGVRVLGRA